MVGRVSNYALTIEYSSRVMSRISKISRNLRLSPSYTNK